MPFGVFSGNMRFHFQPLERHIGILGEGEQACVSSGHPGDQRAAMVNAHVDDIALHQHLHAEGLVETGHVIDR